MFKSRLPLLSLLALAGPSLHAADTGSSWHASSLAEAIGLVALFTLVGVLLAITGYKLFDAATPGDLHREIIENRNVAAAIIGAAIIVGVCIVVAAAIVG